MANIKGLDMGGGTGNAARSGYYVAQVKKPAITEDKSKTYTGTGYNYGTTSTADTGAYTGGGNSYADYLAQLQAAREEAVAKANAAVDEQTKVAERKYNSQLKEIQQDYQDLKNQSEVQRFKAQKAQREALANQGRLEGGAGRMEETSLRNNFSNNLTKIGMQEQSEKEAIANAIAELWANASALKAQNEMSTVSNFGDYLMYGLQNGLGNSYAYNPSTSDYYNTASALASTPYVSSYAVNDGVFAKPTTAAILEALKDEWSNASKGYYTGKTGAGSR